jgi:hypothetical protein
MCRPIFFFDWGQSHTRTHRQTQQQRESRREPKNGAGLSCMKGRASMKGAHSRSSRMGIAGAAPGTTRGRPGPRSLSVRETCLSRAQVDLVVLVLRDEPWRFFCAHVRARRVLVKATQHQPKKKVKEKRKKGFLFLFLPWRSSPRRRCSASVSKLPEAGARGLDNSNRERGRYM